MRHLLLVGCLLVAALRSASSASPVLVSAAELAAARGDQSLVILHIADRASTFEEAHLPGARFVRYQDVAIDGPDAIGAELPPPAAVERVFAAAGVSDDSRVVIYGQSPVTAARAFFTLEAYGHQRVALLDGGLRAWSDAGYPVETGPSRPSPRGRFTPRLQASRLTDAAFIQAQMATGRIALVDVRPDAEFFGRTTMGGAHAAGHIPGARQLTWNALVGSDGRFLPRDELRRQLETAGADGSTPLVAYCMVGMRASVVYFVARYLGYDVKLYDGSIVDWSRRRLPTVVQ